MSRLKKYNFIPEHQLGLSVKDTSPFTVNITKAGALYIKGATARTYALDGKFVRFYADIENKTVAWKEVKGHNLDDMKNIRQFKIDKNNDIVLLSINKIIKQLGVTKEHLPIKGIPVTEYKDTLIDTIFNVIDLREFLKPKN